LAEIPVVASYSHWFSTSSSSPYIEVFNYVPSLTNSFFQFLRIKPLTSQIRSIYTENSKCMACRSHHIQALCKKANKTLNFMRRNLNKCNRSIKASAYLTITRPLLEYASCAWDPHQIASYIWFMTLRKSKGVHVHT